MSFAWFMSRSKTEEKKVTPPSVGDVVELDTVPTSPEPTLTNTTPEPNTTLTNTNKMTYDELVDIVTALSDRVTELEKRHESVFYYDGSMYHGQLKNNIPHGYGSLFYSNGHRYIGYWKDGHYDGYGTLYRDFYSAPFYGEWKQSTPHGKCSYDGILFDTYVNGVKI